MSCRTLPKLEDCRSLNESEALKYLSEVIHKLEKLKNSTDLTSIHDSILRLSTSYYDYYHKFIDKVCDLFIRKNLIYLLHVFLVKFTKPPIDVNDEKVKLIHTLLINFSDHSEKFANKLWSSEILKAIIDNLLFDLSIEQKEKNQFVYMCVLIINNVSRNPYNTIKYHATEIKAALVEFIRINSDDKLGVLSMLTLSYLVEESEIKLLDEGGDTIKKLVEKVRETSNGGNRSDGFTLAELVHGLRSVSVNDNMKVRIVENGGISVLLNILQTETGKVIEPTLGTIENLCFDKNFQSKLKEARIECVIKKFENDENKSVLKRCEGILWKIQNRDKEFHAKQKQTKDSQPKRESFDIFMSYCWANEDKILEIVSFLKKSNLRVWIDRDQMVGSTLAAMANGIESSRLFVVAVSSSYKKSTNCRHEVEYAFKINKPVVPLVMEYKYKADSWLGIFIGANMYYEFSERRDTNKVFSDLIGEIQKRLKPVTESGDEVQMIRTECKKEVRQRQGGARAGWQERISKWKCEDVSNWLREVGLGHLSEQFVGFDGAMMLVVDDIRSSSPDYVNNTLKNEFNMKFCDVIRFHQALNGLMSL